MKDGESSAHILVSRKESLTARRPAARRWPPTLLCHSCDRPLEDETSAFSEGKHKVNVPVVLRFVEVVFFYEVFVESCVL